MKWLDSFSDSSAQLTRIEWKLDNVLRVLTRMEGKIIMAYEAELAAAEAAAKANSDAEDSAEALFKTLADLVAALKTQGTDPTTAQRINDLTTSLNARAAQLAAAVVAGSPAA